MCWSAGPRGNMLVFLFLFLHRFLCTIIGRVTSSSCIHVYTNIDNGPCRFLTTQTRRISILYIGNFPGNGAGDPAYNTASPRDAFRAISARAPSAGWRFSKGRPRAEGGGDGGGQIWFRRRQVYWLGITDPRRNVSARWTYPATPGAPVRLVLIRPLIFSRPRACARRVFFLSSLLFRNAVNHW